MSTSVPPVHRLDDRTLEVDGARFFSEGLPGGAHPDHFMVVKPMPLLEAYADLLATVVGTNIVELGVYEGGSAALAACIARPAKLVALDLRESPPPALVDFVERRSLGGSIRLHFGVDQGDRTRLDGILRDEFGDAPLDLVVDDASHLYHPTLASFETVFPRVRPGGRFIIEDWRWYDKLGERFRASVHDPGSAQHQQALEALGEVVVDAPGFAERLGELLRDAPPEVQAQLDAAAESADASPAQPAPPPPSAAEHDGPSLTRLVLELVMARAWSGDVVASVSVDNNWTVVTRGPADLDPATFRLHDHIGDPAGLLAPLR